VIIFTPSKIESGRVELDLRSSGAISMPIQVTFAPAASYTLDALGDIFTRSFENYYYPGTTTAAILSARVRTEQIDLHRSVVMRVGDAVAGIALLGLRGDRAWCGGFGVMLPFRGRGLAHELAMAMLDQARQASARGCGLEVLTLNQPAIKTYARAGFQPLRDLQVLEWRRPQGPPEPGIQRDDQLSIGQADKQLHQQEDTNLQSSIAQPHPTVLLAHFAALHHVPAAWQRDLPALLVRGGMDGLALMDGERLRAYALLTPTLDSGARVEDIGADDVERAAMLLLALQARYARLISENEPADSALTPAFEAAGFIEVDRQHELWADLQA
jgi:GNAT superfamily N-acetyltransferase